MAPDTLRRYRTHLTILLLTMVSLVHAQDVGDRCTTKNGTPGVCMDLSRCSWARQEIQRKRHPKLCGFDGDTPIVCCQMSTEEVTKPPPVPGGVAGRIALQKCGEYASQVTKTITAVPLTIDAEPVTVKVPKCDISGLPLIVGGEETGPGEFPHMAALGYNVDGKIRWFCGGSLISEWFVLTAAHCVDSRYGPPVRIRLGEQNLKSDNDGAQPWDVGVAQWINHPNYKPPAKYNDISLLRLSKQAPFNAFIRPACLFTNKTFPVSKTVATGWGAIAYAEDPSDNLLKVVLDIFDEESCRRNWKSPSPAVPMGIASSMLCAGVLAGGKDTCQGDSGGPIQIPSQENRCVYHIIGITSFGRQCASENSLAVYTRVSSYVPWIESIVWS